MRGQAIMAADPVHNNPDVPPSRHSGRQYQVVARRYRPRDFDQLLGQEHIAQALGNAILAKRVGHAYLFTGARGVGKTSAARIFGKALNCVQGPTPKPCNVCDICLSIDAGEDVDVLELDGASNRGIDEIRQIRSNANIRPSRAPYKVYIIDEVHMLTTQAFNALLKTLEEPPDHVKFIFCTTDPEKLPITVLSRCQRYDFSPIVSESIMDRLREICREEGREVEEAGLALLARRAAGSMRDSQSLLEQLLAFGGQRITLADVHGMLGIADGTMLDALVHCLAGRDAAGALTACDQTLCQGVEAGHLAEQLLAYWRDMLVAAVHGSANLALQVDPEGWSQVTQQAEQLGPETLLAGAQILDQTLVRMRQSTHARILLEMALIRICQLERLDDLGAIVEQLRRGDGIRMASDGSSRPQVAAGPRASAAPQAPSTPAARAGGSTPEKKTKNPPHVAAARTESNPRQSNQRESPGQESPPIESAKETPAAGTSDEPSRRADQSPPVRGGLDPRTVEEVWQRVLQSLEDMTADFAACADRVAISAPNRLVVNFPAAYNLQKEACERPDRKGRIETTLSEIVGCPVTVELRVMGAVAAKSGNSPARSSQHRRRETERHEMVQQVIELFDAEIVRVEPARPTDPSTNGAS
jgi:DNA polymerase III subunit gamma/tau